MKIIIKIITTIFVIFLLILLTLGFLDSNKTSNTNISTKDIKELYQNFTSFINTNPSSDRLTLAEFEAGFWYQTLSNGKTDIFFFNTPVVLKSKKNKKELITFMDELLKNSLITKNNNLKTVSDSDLPDLMSFYNKIVLNTPQKNKEIENEIIHKKQKTFNDYYHLAQLYSIRNEFDLASEETKLACRLNPQNRYCQKIKIKIFDKDKKLKTEIETYQLQKNNYNFTVFSPHQKEYIIPD